ncbi:MAG TPA: cupin-like domain-containing protein, partial [Polyangiaceae bacterium]|nr:cupin-like domain-containing protein [Polyangiaceae bacterium]
MTLEVERVGAGNSKALAARLESGRVPLVIVGGAAHWRATATWTPEYLEQRLGTVELDYKISSSNAHPDFRRSELGEMFARSRGTLGELLRKISTGPEAERARFLFTGDEQFLLRRRDGVTTKSPLLEPLLLDVEVPSLFSEQQLYTVWSWFSGRGVRTWLHYDNNGCHNLNAQITGHKQCWLYAPEELPRLHPFLLGGPNPAHNCSQIDVEQPQPEFAVDLQAARAWHAELSAGDLLFIPAWWFHTFTHHGPFNSNVNFWWKPEEPRWNQVAARQALLDAAARATLADRAQAAPVLR